MSPQSRRVDFGYNPPSGTRGVEHFPARTFVRDLQDALDIASQSFASLWVSDHLMTVEPFRMECWTQLTWIAARYPGPLLGTIVMANNYRHPPLMAKMAATLQAFSRGRLILGYGAGWHEQEAAEDDHLAEEAETDLRRDEDEAARRTGQRPRGRRRLCLDARAG